MRAESFAGTGLALCVCCPMRQNRSCSSGPGDAPWDHESFCIRMTRWVSGTCAGNC
jgi:hypothetical protein